MILDKIKSRGYWAVVIHPAVFSPHRVAPLPALHRLVEDLSVHLRGWSFPPVGPQQDIIFGADHIEQSIDHRIHLELWRLYDSGKFIGLRGIWSDWRDQGDWAQPAVDWQVGSWMGLREIVFQCTEITEFATRLAMSVAGDTRIRVEIRLEGLTNRRLYDDGEWRQAWQKNSGSPSYVRELVLERTELLARKDDIAAELSSDIFARFGWQPPLDMVRQLQSDMLGRRVA